MASNASIFTSNSLLSLRVVGFPRFPISQLHTRTRIQPNPLHTTRLGLSSSSSSSSSSSVSASTNGLKSDGGGGNGGSGDGNSGGGDNGSNSGGGEGGKNWSLLAWYLSLLEKYPVWTKAVTSALLTLFGDLICQLWIDQVASVDVKRTLLFTFLGLVLVGPTLHFWYLYLSRLVTTPGVTGTLMRLVLDQFLFAPIFVGVFLSSLVTLEGRSSQVIPKLQQEWFSSVLANWQLWIPFQFFNFRFVPQQFQVLAANFIALVWNVILSYKAHKEVIVK
ncbi:protein sym-1 isoform X2 [Solanum tuberosum]|uniref:protein sym-1 isoform X2 n=1 Tax=Solanum tuberosum TaxID=4113 RepID=UPI00073A44DF|nr:PREDICTED: protein sym-1 isoform X2 [Solanum tuberosum]